MKPNEHLFEFNPPSSTRELFPECGGEIVPVTGVTVSDDGRSRVWMWARNKSSFWFVGKFQFGTVYVAAEKSWER